MCKEDVLEIIDELKKEYGSPSSRVEDEKIYSLIKVILSQNTNGKNRDRAYNSLFSKYRSPKRLLDVDVDEIAEAISVAGLQNKKAERIQGSLRRIWEERGELDIDFLDDWSLSEARDWLMELPGVGPKSAAVVLNFDFDKDAFPVDTHVFRVSKRLGLIPSDVNREEAHELLEDLVPGEKMEEFHLNLIRLGREVCKAPVPICSDCFLTEDCEYYQDELGDMK